MSKNELLLEDFAGARSDSSLSANTDHHPLHTEKEGVAWELIKNFPRTVGSRFISVTFFYISYQMYLRRSPQSLAIGAMLSIFFNISNVMRELMRMITNMTKEELDATMEQLRFVNGLSDTEMNEVLNCLNNSESQLIERDVPASALSLLKRIASEFPDASYQELKQSVTRQADNAMSDMFLVAGMSTLVPTLLCFAVNQSLILLLENVRATNESQFVYDATRWIPSIFVANTFLLNLLTAWSNRAYALKELNQLLVIYPIGALSIFSTQFLWREIMDPTRAFMLANTVQNFSICFLLGWKDFYYHADQKIFSAYFDRRKWLAAFKRAVASNISSVQFAIFSASEYISDVVWPAFISDPNEAASVVGLKFITNIFVAIGVYEQTLVVRIIEAYNAHKDDPVRLKRELRTILICSSAVTVSLPLVFSVVVMVLGRDFLTLLFNDTEENAPILDKAQRDLFLTCLMMNFKSICSAPFSMVSAFRLHELNANRFVTGVRTAAPLVTLGAGWLGDFMGYGARGFWAAGSFCLFVSMLLQYTTAVKVMAHQVSLAAGRGAGVEPQENQSSTSTWTAFFQPAARALTNATTSVKHAVGYR